MTLLKQKSARDDLQFNFPDKTETKSQLNLAFRILIANVLFDMGSIVS